MGIGGGAGLAGSVDSGFSAFSATPAPAERDSSLLPTLACPLGGSGGGGMGGVTGGGSGCEGTGETEDRGLGGRGGLGVLEGGDGLVVSPSPGGVPNAGCRGCSAMTSSQQETHDLQKGAERWGKLGDGWNPYNARTFEVGRCFSKMALKCATFLASNYLLSL